MTHKNWKPVVRCSTIVVATLLAANAYAQQRSFNLPEQEATQSLPEFARQAGIQIAAPTEQLKGMRTPQIKGEFDIRAALKQLLQGTGLTVASDENGMIVLQKAIPTQGSAATTPMRGKGTGVRLAQATGEQSEPDKNSASVQGAAEEKSTKLEEIIVTATRRAQRINDVPMSIAVVSAEDIDRRGLVNSEDYLRGIPGVNQMEGRQGQSTIIRGIETTTTDQNFGTGTTVATYFGETPTTTSAGTGGGSNIDLKLVDIERVEVLRGPQGTAFGSASMGGAVRTIPVAPKLSELTGKVGGGYSATASEGGDNYNAHIIGNIPLIADKLAVRATAYRFDDSGYYRNRAASNAAFQSSIVNVYGAQASAFNEDEVGGYSSLGGRVSALFQASQDLRFTLSYVMQKTERDGFALANSGTYEQTLLGVAPEHIGRGQRAGRFDTDVDIANAVMEYNFGWSTFLGTYSYTKSGSVQAVPFGTFSSLYPLSLNADSDHREHVGEIRLVTQLDGPLNFLAGLYAEKLDDEVLYDYLWHGNPAASPLALGAAQALGSRYVAEYPDQRNLKQRAAFGEVSWQMISGLTLTGGVRGYKYDRTRRVDANGAFYGAAGTHVSSQTETSGENFRANLSYKLDDDALVYGGWSQGFRLGQPQTGVPAGACDLNNDGLIDGTGVTVEATRSIDSDNVDNLEIGGKFTLLDRRLSMDVAVFRMNWSDIPVRVRTGSSVSTCSLLTYTTNVGEAVSEGVEFQANLQVSEPFRIDLGGSWNRARLSEAVPAIGAARNNRLPGSPEFNANLGLQYEFDLGGHTAYVRADSIYVGSFYGDLLQSPSLESGGYVKIDSSARVQLGSLSVDLFVQNLTNEDAFTYRGATTGLGQFYGYRLRPRTVGLRLGYIF